MPEVSRFFGVVIRMYFDDHDPPHFHACYGDMEAQVGLSPIGLLNGHLPRRAESLVVEWAALHQGELLENWRRLQGNEPPRKIAPLE